MVKSLVGVEDGLAHFGSLGSIFDRCVSRLGPLGNTGWVFASQRTARVKGFDALLRWRGLRRFIAIGTDATPGLVTVVGASA